MTPNRKPRHEDGSRRRRLRWARLGLLVGCVLAAGPVRAADADGEPAGEATERQILVTLASKPSALPRPAGSSARPYVGLSAYAVSQRTRRMAARLARKYDLHKVDEWPIEALGVHCLVFEVAGDVPLAEVIEKMGRDKRVESVQRLQEFQVKNGPYDDPYAEMQYALNSMQVWDVHPWSVGRDVTVAVVDTGVDAAHPDLSGRIALSRDFVADRRRAAPSERHGTAVAGIIVSSAGNGVGTVGVAPGSRLLALRACWESPDGGPGTCNSFTLAKALAFVADRRPDVLNLSLAGPADALLERLIDVVLQRGVTVVTAHERAPEGFPGSVAGVLVVESACRWPDWHRDLIPAPGLDILTTVPGAAFDFVSGSSFAAAHVSGVVALLLERNRRLPAERLHRLLLDAVRTQPGPGGEPQAVLDACAALAQVVPEASCGGIASRTP